MEYKAKSCVVCGNEELKLISHKIVEDKVFYTYKCVACGETFSTETAFLKKQERLKRQEQQIAEASIISKNSSQEMSAIEIYNQSRENVVAITAEFDKNVGFGTGMIIGNGYVLSNAHVVLNLQHDKAEDYPNSISCVLSNGDSVELDLIYADVKKDIAVLQGDGISNTGVSFFFGEVQTGERIFAIGNSKAQGICILDGIVSDRERALNNEKYIMYSALTVRGNSGGPIFNAQGKVIGMTCLGQKDSVAMNYAIPVSVINWFIDKANEQEDLNIKLK